MPPKIEMHKDYERMFHMGAKLWIAEKAINSQAPPTYVNAVLDSYLLDKSVNDLEAIADA